MLAIVMEFTDFNRRVQRSQGKILRFATISSKRTLAADVIADEADKQMGALVIRYIRFIRYHIRCQPKSPTKTPHSSESVGME
jgi:hypothetical protein